MIFVYRLSEVCTDASGLGPWQKPVKTLATGKLGNPPSEQGKMTNCLPTFTLKIL